jgi:hypothetical protein
MSAESRGRQRCWLPKILIGSALSAQFSALFLLTGCAIPHVPARIVYEDPVNYVRLEEDKSVLPEWPQGHFSHPSTIGPEKVRVMLSGLKVQEHRIAPQRWIQGEAPVLPAFNDEELTLLSTYLAEGLAKANYNERVTFYLSQPQTSIKRVVTSGGVYVQGNEFHLILGNWKIVYGIPAYGMIYDRRYPMRPSAAKGFDLLFEPAEAAYPLKSSLFDDLIANAKDELVFDMSKIDFPNSVPATTSPNVF